MQHHRNHEFFAPATGRTRIGAIAEFLPHAVKVPKISTADAISIAANDLIEALKHPQPSLPSLQLTMIIANY